MKDVFKTVVVCMVLLILASSVSRNGDESADIQLGTSGVTVTSYDISEELEYQEDIEFVYSSFVDNIFMNGIKQTIDEYDVIVVEEEVYFSSVFLNETYRFELTRTGNEYEMSIRNLDVDISVGENTVQVDNELECYNLESDYDIIKMNGCIYLPMDLLSNFIYYDENLYRNTGDIYMESNTLYDITYKNLTYEPTDKIFVKADCNEIVDYTEDGKAIYNRDSSDNIYVENDDKQMYEYEVKD